MLTDEHHHNIDESLVFAETMAYQTSYWFVYNSPSSKAHYH